jgi:hypothetical protein
VSIQHQTNRGGRHPELGPDQLLGRRPFRPERLLPGVLIDGSRSSGCLSSDAQNIACPNSTGVETRAPYMILDEGNGPLNAPGGEAMSQPSVVRPRPEELRQAAD